MPSIHFFTFLSFVLMIFDIAALALPMDRVRGVYPVLLFNDTDLIGAELEIISSEIETGFILRPLKNAPHQLPNLLKVLTPTKDTQFKESAIEISQDYETPTKKVHNSFTIRDGYLEVTAETCENNLCSFDNMFVSTGKALGQERDPHQFFSSRKGNYQIEKVQGVVPKDTFAEVGLDSNEGIVTLPFCSDDGVCDPGFLSFPLSKTRIFERPLGPNKVLFILITQDSPLQYYSWIEEKVGTDVSGNDIMSYQFGNFQYTLNTEKIYLEHIFKKIM